MLFRSGVLQNTLNDTVYPMDAITSVDDLSQLLVDLDDVFLDEIHTVLFSVI